MTELLDSFILRPLTVQAEKWMQENIPEYPGSGRPFTIDWPYIVFILDALGDTDLVEGIDYDLRR